MLSQTSEAQEVPGFGLTGEMVSTYQMLSDKIKVQFCIYKQTKQQRPAAKVLSV